MFKNSTSIHSFHQKTLLRISKGKLDWALKSIAQLVEKIISDPLTVSQGFGSRALDDLCQCIGKISLADIRRSPELKVSDKIDSGLIVYIVTKMQNSGGHTRVIFDLVQANLAKRHLIISTELLGWSELDYVDNIISDLNNIDYELSTHRSHLEKLKWLQSRLLVLRPSKVYLFNHHQDSVAVAAVQQSMGLDVTYCHHGDHHLSLGVFLTGVAHVDLHISGFNNCHQVLGIDNGYLPLVAKDMGCRGQEDRFLASGALVTCTVGRANKIEQPYFVNYCSLIPRLLKVSGGKHIHIGRLTPWALLKIKFFMMLNKVEFHKFIYISSVPSVWKALQKYKVDLYISSFPYVGILTLIEAMGSGTPIVIHRHIFSRILSGIDIAYPGAQAWRFPEELIAIIGNISPEKLSLMSKNGRMHYEKFHKEFIPHTVPQNMSSGMSLQNKEKNYEVQSDELALWLSNQNSLMNLMRKNIYRILKRLIK